MFLFFRPFALVMFLAWFSAAALAVETPTAEQVLAALRKEHPRLLVKADGFRTLAAKVAAVPEAGRWATEIRQAADGLLETPPSQYVIPDGKRLLYTSRAVLDRTLTLAMTFQLTREARYRDRLWRELEAAAHFKDWNPSHYLDTAEMTAALALGYDWMHAEWTPAQRAELKQAIVEKGLTPSLELYRGHHGWPAQKNNWNQVCNGGMTLGALAVADEAPEISGEILAAAIRSVPRAMQSFAPDGAWGEGPMYWDYATKYNVFMLAALDSALGTDYGLAKIDGFAKAGEFPIFTTGPLGLSFNYADANAQGPGGAQLLWLATKFDAPALAAWRLQHTLRTPGALDLLWGAAWLEHPPKGAELPLARYFRDAEVVTMRSAWEDPEATFVGFKGGDNRVTHSHLDLGSFVLDAAGCRWAFDLGPDDYNLPGYFGDKRWAYYRCRAEGQNTLVLNPGEGPDQETGAAAPIQRFESQPGRAFAIADLTAAYAKSATRVRRGIALQGRQVVVQDEIAAREPAHFYWFLHTTAEIACDGATARLTLEGRHLSARILSPAGATFRVLPVEPLATSPHPPRQQVKASASAPTPSGARKLTVELKEVRDLTLTVLLTPDPEAPVPTVKPLAEW
jgi:hypothetical protein